MSNKLPLILLTFANEQQGGRYLDNVVKESKELFSILQPISANMNPSGRQTALCELVIKNNVNLSEIIEVLNVYKDRDIIFHFGGHADGYQLLLEGKDGEAEVAQGEGLVAILSRRKNLKLVFLNGCSTQRLARDLVEHGILSVIGTSASISDEVALMLSSRFYKGLAGGLSMAGAWEEAKDEVRALKNPGRSTRGIKLDAADADRFPWDVEFRDDAAKRVFNEWNLPEAAENPLFNLPAPKPAQLPAEPFLFLKPYEAQHAEIFFGRSRYIRELWLKILEPVSPPIILLYGESGAGKSSLLDAGLRPRLEAATTDEAPPKPVFEVRYQRRDQDEGLVGTLARMLGYHPEADAEAVAVESAETEDRNVQAQRELEKLEQLEALATELEEEKARYTLLSIIDRYRNLQTEVPLKKVPVGLYRNGALDPEAGAKLRQAWHAIETKTGRRLVVILDQVEELFTRPNETQGHELEDLLRVLKVIFSNSAAFGNEPIRGKIILGYREEFNAKIEARVKDEALSRSTVFLEQLNDADIRDIFQGLQTGRAQLEYNIQVEEKLPGLVANHLLNGKSAVAPVLQLLLTKLWKNAYRENSHAPAFTVAAYQQVQSRGEEMEEYFMAQMKKISHWDPGVVESGLALDILHFHVSDLGTSNRRHIETIEQRYKHLSTEFNYPADFIVKLVNKLKSPEVFLLNDLGRGFTSLPHDTLAPIIIREYNRSDKFGQRSARILDTKAPDLVRALSEGEESLKKLRLDDNDLEVIQEGQKGMRSLEERERKLLQISLDERQKRLRLRRMLVKGGIVAGLFILILSIFAGSLSVSMTDQLKNVNAGRAHEASLISRDKNLNVPDPAIQLAQFAYRENELKRVDIVSNLYDLYQDYNWKTPDYLYSENFDPDTSTLSISLKNTAKISSMQYFPDLGSLVSLEDVTVKYRARGSAPEQEQIIDLREGFANIKALEVGFSADGKKIQVVSRFDRRPLYLLDKVLVSSPRLEIYIPSWQDQSDYQDLDEEAGIQDEVAADTFAHEFVGHYDLFTGKFIDVFDLQLSKEEFLDLYEYDLASLGYDDELAVLTRSGTSVSVESLFSFRLLIEEKHLLNKNSYDLLKEQPWISDVALPELGPEADTAATLLRPTNLSGALYNGIFIWDPNNLNREPETILYDTAQLFYLSSLEDNKFLIVGTEGEVQIREVQELYTPGSTVANLMGPGSDLIDIILSPDRRHIATVTGQDSVIVWNLQGERITQFRHTQLVDYAFSGDGSNLMTLSGDSVRVWSATGGKFSTFSRPAGTPPVSFARFHTAASADDEYLVIGLSYAALAADDLQESFWEKLGFGNKKNRIRNARIAFWNIWKPDEIKIFQAPSAVLLDATVSADQQFAVALQPGLATIIPLAGADGGKAPEPFQKTIEAQFSGRRAELKRSKVQLSPGGSYIIRQSAHERKVELFACNGEPVNAYSFENGFRQGFNGQLFTPDDHFLISSKPTEVLFLHPEHAETGKVIEWAERFELEMGDKQLNDLDTFMDYLPGARLRAKWWAVALVLGSLIFVLLYFSDFIIQFVQQKNYLQIGLYSLGLLLFSLILLTLWARGAAEPELKRTALYLMVFAALAVASFAMMQAWKQAKYALLAVIAAFSLFALFGAAGFYSEEVAEHNTAYLKEIQKDYEQQKSYYDSLYLAGGAATAISARQKLSAAQLADVVRSNKDLGFDYIQPKQQEWPNLLYALLILLLFAALVGYPAYRALGTRRREKEATWGFYRWLFPAVVCSALGFWIAYGVIMEDDFGFATENLLNILSVISLAGMLLYQSRIYISTRQYGPLFTYGLLLALILALLLPVSGAFAAAIALTFVLGLRYKQRGAPGRSFILFSSSIFLTSGALCWAVLAENELILAGLLLAGVLALIFLGLRQQLHHSAARKAAQKARWLNRLAILGLWIAALFATTFFADSMGTVSYEVHFEDEYYYPEEDGSPEEEEATETEEVGELDLSGEIPAEDTTPTETATDTTESLESANMSESTDSGDAPPKDRQQLVEELFAADKNLRIEAWAGLKADYSQDPALIGELIGATYEHPEVPEGILNALYLIELQTDLVLQEQADQLLPYLEQIRKPDLEKRIQALLERINQ